MDKAEIERAFAQERFASALRRKTPYHKRVDIDPEKLWEVAMSGCLPQGKSKINTVEIFQLVYNRGLSVREAARLLGSHESALRHRLNQIFYDLMQPSIQRLYQLDDSVVNNGT